MKNLETPVKTGRVGRYEQGMWYIALSWLLSSHIQQALVKSKIIIVLLKTTKNSINIANFIIIIITLVCNKQ